MGVGSCLLTREGVWGGRLQSDNCTERHFIFLAYYLALKSQEGSVITVALGGQRSPVALLWKEGMLGVPSG